MSQPQIKQKRAIDTRYSIIHHFYKNVIISCHRFALLYLFSSLSFAVMLYFFPSIYANTYGIACFYISSQSQRPMLAKDAVLTAEQLGYARVG